MVRYIFGFDEREERGNTMTRERKYDNKREER